MFILSSVLVLSPLPAFAGWVMSWETSKQGNTYNCYAPVEFKTVRAVGANALLKLPSRDEMILTTRPGRSLETRPMAELVLVRGTNTIELELESLTLNFDTRRILSRGLAISSRRLKDDLRLILKVNEDYQIFRPALVEEGERPTYEQMLGNAFESYKEETRKITSWDQLEVFLSKKADFNPLLRSSFTIFERLDATMAIVLSGPKRHMAICLNQDAEKLSKANLQENIYDWLDSKDVQQLLACESLLSN